MYLLGPNFAFAAEGIAASYNMALRNSSEGPVFILGTLTNVNYLRFWRIWSYITCPTRKSKTLDKCFGNVAGDALHPPLGRSDHNVIHLLPKYRQMLKRTDPLIGLKIHLKNSETIL